MYANIYRSRFYIWFDLTADGLISGNCKTVYWHEKLISCTNLCSAYRLINVWNTTNRFTYIQLFNSNFQPLQHTHFFPQEKVVSMAQLNWTKRINNKISAKQDSRVLIISHRRRCRFYDFRYWYVYPFHMTVIFDRQTYQKENHSPGIKANTQHVHLSMGLEKVRKKFVKTDIEGNWIDSVFWKSLTIEIVFTLKSSIVALKPFPSITHSTLKSFLFQN